MRNNANVKSLGGVEGGFCVADGTICFTAPFHPEPLSKSECEELKDELGIQQCYEDNDYWAGAVKECGGVDKMLTYSEAHLNALMSIFCDVREVGTGSTVYITADCDPNKYLSFGFNPNDILWFNLEAPTDYPNLGVGLDLGKLITEMTTSHSANPIVEQLRNNSSSIAICIADK